MNMPLSVLIGLRLVGPTPSTTVEHQPHGLSEQERVELADLQSADAMEARATTALGVNGGIAALSGLGAVAALAHAENTSATPSCTTDYGGSVVCDEPNALKRDRRAITAFAVIGGVALGAAAIALIVRAVARKRQRRLRADLGGLALRF